MWNSVEEFAKWYEENGFPIRPPQNNAVFRTNNANAVVVYREGQYQVEMYIADPNSITPEHSHPDVESIIMFLTGEGSTTVNSKEVADPSPYFNMVNPDGTSILFKQQLRITPKDTHGLTTYNRGFAFFSIEKWPDGVEPTSVAVHWHGDTTGNIHDKLVQGKNNE